VPIASVAKLAAINSAYPQQLATAAALSPATTAALAKAPTSSRVQDAAVGEIALKMRVLRAAAAGLLQSLGKVAPATLAFVRATGPRVQAASAQLASVASIPATDLAYLKTYGSKVANAKKQNPGQWQTWWWICFVGQLVFIPLALLLKGRWSPRKAREDELEHEKKVERELANLSVERAIPPAFAAATPPE